VSQTVRRTYSLSATEFSRLALQPFDRVRFNAVYSDRDSGEISLFGQIKYPGAYEILRGEHLSSLLKRAGGFTDAAYPAGAIFLRRSVAEQQRGVLHREADSLERQLATLVGSHATREKISDSEINYVNQLVQRLRQTGIQGGRIAVQIDPREVAAHPELDLVLEPGDQLFVPRKPSSVIVAGEVMSAGGIQYRAGQSVADYVALAGGTTEIADDDHMFVIRPDGSAIQVSRGWFTSNAIVLTPGSVIVVPRTLNYFTWDALLASVTQVTSQLAITAASIAVIFR
jgi:protein involved in polysaccharide export with SLBB domain